MAISDDLNSIRTHLEDDYEALEQLGVSVEDRNIENIKDMANQIYAKFPKTSYAEGSNITLSNTLKGKLDYENNIVGYGDTSQESYEGYNLLPSVNTTRTINGVTFTHNADGSITANGTASANALYPINVDGTSVTRNVSLVAGSYVIVDSVGDYTNYFCQLSDGTNFANTGSGGAVGKSNTITLSSQANVSALVYIRSGVTINNVTFKPMVVTSSNIDKSYEPYVGGIASPNPSYPQDIEVVRGKNIWHFTNNNFVSNSNTTSNIINENKLEVTSTNTTYANTKFLLSEKGNDIFIPDGQYTFSIGKVTNTNSSMTRQLITLSTYTNGVRAVIDNIIVGTPKTIAITNAPNKRYILEFWGSYDTALINTATFEEIQIEKGSQATSYLPYNTLEVKARGKNKLDFSEWINTLMDKNPNITSGSIDNHTDNSITITANGSDCFTASYTISNNAATNKTFCETYPSLVQEVKGNTKYTISYNRSNTSLIARPCFFYLDKNYNYLGLDENRTTTDNATFTTPSNAKYLTLRFGIYNSTESTLTISNLMIEESSSATTYEPYQTPQTYQLSLGEYEFAKIGNYVDTIEYDVENDKVYKNENIIKKAITSEMATQIIESADYGNYIVINSNASIDMTSTTNNVMCNIAIPTSYDNRLQNVNNYRIFTNVSGNTIILRLPVGSSIDTLEEAKQLITNTNMYVIVKLATPTKTEITGTLKDQIKALYNSHSFTGTTIIEIDGQLPLIIKVSALKGE